MWNLKRNDTNEITYKTEKDTDLENKPMVVGWGKDGGKGWLGSLDGHVHTVIFKMDNQEGPTV